MLAAFTLEPSDWSTYLEELVTTFAPARSEILWESPDILDESRPRLYDDFKELVASAQSEVLISSPYFIPDAEFRALLRELVAQRRARRRRHELARDEQSRRRAHGLSALATRGARGRRRAVRASRRCGCVVALRDPARERRAARVAHEGRHRRRRARVRRLAECRPALDGVEHRDRRRRQRTGIRAARGRRSSSATSRRRMPGASR